MAVQKSRGRCRGLGLSEARKRSVARDHNRVQSGLPKVLRLKPVAMVANAIRDCSHRKGIVLDAFVGSGAALIAAEKTGRRGYGIEIDPAYCDVTIRRLRAACGLEAVLEATRQRLPRSSLHSRCGLHTRAVTNS